MDKCGRYLRPVLDGQDVVIAPKAIPINGSCKYAFIHGSKNEKGLKFSNFHLENIEVFFKKEDDNPKQIGEVITDSNAQVEIKLELYQFVIMLAKTVEPNLPGRLVVIASAYSQTGLTTLEIVLIVLSSVLGCALFGVSLTCYVIRRKGKSEKKKEGYYS